MNCPFPNPKGWKRIRLLDDFSSQPAASTPKVTIGNKNKWLIPSSNFYRSYGNMLRGREPSPINSILWKHFHEYNDDKIFAPNSNDISSGGHIDPTVREVYEVTVETDNSTPIKTNNENIEGYDDTYSDDYLHAIQRGGQEIEDDEGNTELLVMNDAWAAHFSEAVQKMQKKRNRNEGRKKRKK